jgi:isopenicillin N synthase-like dioxygenase
MIFIVHRCHCHGFASLSPRFSSQRQVPTSVDASRLFFEKEIETSSKIDLEKPDSPNITGSKRTPKQNGKKFVETLKVASSAAASAGPSTTAGRTAAASGDGVHLGLHTGQWALHSSSVRRQLLACYTFPQQ